MFVHFPAAQLITLAATFLNHRYEAGDHVAVYPVNDRETVEKIGKRLNVDLNTVFTLTNVDGES